MEKRIMKKRFFTYILPGILVLFITSCIKDSVATQYATGDQIGGSKQHWNQWPTVRLLSCTAMITLAPFLLRNLVTRP